MRLPTIINFLVPGRPLSSKSNRIPRVQSEYLLSSSNASNVGIVPGIFLNGWLAAKYGYRKVIIVALFFLNAFIFITFFAPNKPVLVVGQILCGFSWGVFATIGPAYASEIVPLQLRGYLTSYVNLCCKHFASISNMQLLTYRRGHWPIHRCRCAQRSCRQNRPMVLSHPICRPMGMARTPHDCLFLRSRIALVHGPQQQARLSPTHPQAHLNQHQRRRNQRNTSHDGPHRGNRNPTRQRSIANILPPML